MQNKLILDINEKPSSIVKWFILSLQHVFGMFSATILVPLLTGLDIGVALIGSGIGTLSYILITKGKVPIYLGSSFAYIAAISLAITQSGPDSAFTALMGVGLVYMIVAFILKFTSSSWINKLLPPVVIGPVIMVIGLSLAYVAIDSSGLGTDGSSINALIALVTFTTAAVLALRGKGFLRIIPFIIAILVGYTFAASIGAVSFNEAFSGVSILRLPDFQFIGSYTPNFTMLAVFLPLSFVTIAEHIGDHKVLGEITGKDFIEEPGLKRTIMGDGVATFLSASMGGPANTSYGENTGIIAMNKVGSVYVIGLAAIIAIFLGFSGYVQAFILSIPSGVIGGISIILYGLIAANGIKVLAKGNVNLNESRNMIIISVILVVGLGGAFIQISDVASVSGMSLAAVFGIILNQVLPYSKPTTNATTVESTQ